MFLSPRSLERYRFGFSLGAMVKLANEFQLITSLDGIDRFFNSNFAKYHPSYIHRTAHSISSPTELEELKSKLFDEKRALNAKRFKRYLRIESIADENLRNRLKSRADARFEQKSQEFLARVNQIIPQVVRREIEFDSPRSLELLRQDPELFKTLERIMPDVMTPKQVSPAPAPTPVAPSPVSSPPASSMAVAFSPKPPAPTAPLPEPTPAAPPSSKPKATPAAASGRWPLWLGASALGFGTLGLGAYGAARTLAGSSSDPTQVRR